MLKQAGLHWKQNPLSWAVASLNWWYIYWTHTFPKSSWSLDRKLCHLVARTITKKDFCKTWKMHFLSMSNCYRKSNWYLITRTKLPKCDFNKVAKHLDGCFCIRNVKHRIHSANTSLLFTLAKIISKAKNLILFPYCCLYGVFSSCVYRSLYYARFFSTAILLSSQLAKNNVYFRLLSNLGQHDILLVKYSNSLATLIAWP